MQSEPPEHGVPASTPPLSSFRPTPTPARAGLERKERASVSPSRSRVSALARDHDMLSLHIRTPDAELGLATPKAWSVSAGLTVREAKDAIASGVAGHGQWEREGLRLVWRGRMLRDEDVLRTVFGPNETQPTVHLVARLLAPIVTVPVPTRAATPPPSTANTTAVAINDCVHYLLFSSREQLCHVVGAPVLAWDDMYPKPTVSRDAARAAVMSVVRSTLPHLEWQGAFDSDHEAIWTRLGRNGAADEVRNLWTAAVGRGYSNSGESVPVELDGMRYSLVLPPLANMAPSQLVHLLLYLRINSLLPDLYTCLEAAQVPTNPTPTPTTSPMPAGHATANVNVNTINVPRGVQVYRAPSLQFPRIPFVWLQHQLFSAVRMAALLSMLVGGIGLNDPRTWMLITAAVGWWAFDGVTQWQAIRTRERAEALRERMANAGRDAQREAQGGAVPTPGAHPAEEENPLDPALMAAGQPRQQRAQLNPVNPVTTNLEWLKAVPLWNLDHDAYFLRLPQPNMRAPLQPGPVPQTRPNFIMCRIVLPIYLWFVTLVPVFEASRARAIRQRERTMRSLVNDLTPAAAETAPAEEERPRVLPDSLLPQVKQYYLNVVSREEQIDWEEEREAQRAMGIRDEEAVPML